MQQWTWGCRHLFKLLFLFSLDKYTEVGLLDHVVALSLISWGISILFSIAAITIFIQTNCAWVFFSPHLEQHSWFLVFWTTAILIDLRWYLSVILIYSVSFPVSVGISICSLDKCLFRSFAHFLPKLLVFYYSVVCIIYIFLISTFFIFMICKYFFPFSKLSYFVEDTLLCRSFCLM